MATQNVLRSQVAYDIIRSLRESQKYSKEIAESIGSTKYTVSSYIQSLRDKGIIERGKRTKAQYYDIDYETISLVWLNTVVDHFEQVLSNNNIIKINPPKKKEKKILEIPYDISKKLEDDKNISELLEDPEKTLKELKDLELDLPTFLRFYINNYTELVSESTIFRMLFTDMYFILDLLSYRIESSFFPKDIKVIKEVLGILKSSRGQLEMTHLFQEMILTGNDGENGTFIEKIKKKGGVK